MSNMVVQTNMLALNAHRSMGLTGNAQARASARLSSGFRINSAADDAAGLAISETMRAQIRGLDQASRNAQDGISLIQTAEGALNTVNAMLVRVRELTVQASNDTYTNEDRQKLWLEVNQLFDEMSDTIDRVEFNTMALLNNSIGDLHLQIGANTSNGTTVLWRSAPGIGNVFNMDTSGDPTNHWGHVIRGTEGADQARNALRVVFEGGSGSAGQRTQILELARWGTPASVTFANYDALIPGATLWANASGGERIASLIQIFDGALDVVTSARAQMGAWMNRLEYTIENLDLASENLAAANSRIRDADMAREMMRFTQTNVLQQAAISMLAQANMAPQNILQLLR